MTPWGSLYNRGIESERVKAMIDIGKITVENLNQLTCTQVSLILLRCLNTSDLTFMHDLFKVETLKTSSKSHLIWSIRRIKRVSTTVLK